MLRWLVSEKNVGFLKTLADAGNARVKIMIVAPFLLKKLRQGFFVPLIVILCLHLTTWECPKSTKRAQCGISLEKEQFVIQGCLRVKSVVFSHKDNAACFCKEFR